MPFPEKTLALANMCIVLHITGKLFNIRKELFVRKHISGNLFLHSSPITHPQMSQKHAINR